MPIPPESQLPGLPGFDPDNLQPWTIQVVVSVTVLALCSTVLRVVSRRLNSQKLWWDDWMILFSMGWNLVVVGFIFAMYASGMGLHADLVDPTDIVMMAQWLVVAEILYAFNLGWTKLSLLLMYYRIFRFPYFKRMAWIVGVFVMAWVVCITFLFVFICVPVEKLWYPELPGHCINQVGTWIANAISTIFTDLVILLMPIPQVWRLNLKMREKLGLTAAFGLGSFVVFASAYRTSVLFTYDKSDPTYTLTPTVGWTAIEMSAGITSACLPTLLPVLNKVLRWFRGRGNGESSTGYARGPGASGGRDVSRHDDKMTSAAANSRRHLSSSFFRLPDESEPDRVDSAAKNDSKLDLHSDSKKGHEPRLQVVPKDGDGESSDDIPLERL
ncbi:uncharacterized protein J7T54_007765 [Emericellopsis cladophorae]|uniref:Rhodopsin domain-containing protein n=1 Tax=Emericellopsis cladophorae TaxID=2686198 RepID=A0A9P9XX86_9HYPO|nr:uncharacterized protein J7T54_007765 [Emericellopsis cladophorae]KAI6779238.1 hypothetical protein J7T54_007765 [Emericellopsis cladophorae]